MAEVLITLGIIGIICAITIPTLIQKQQEKQTVVALQKVYSTISNAYNLALQENGTPDQWPVAENSPAGMTEAMLNTLAPYLNVTKNCGRKPGCWPASSYKTINNNILGEFNESDVYAKAQLADGSIILLYNNFASSISCNGSYGNSTVCAIYRVDINGIKPPNVWGKDLFTFLLTKTNVVPDGTASGAGYPFVYCEDPSQNDQGRGCTAWVLYNENMDYLHCSNLSWNGKTKCN